jgi:hypothetical protein
MASPARSSNFLLPGNLAVLVALFFITLLHVGYVCKDTANFPETINRTGCHGEIITKIVNNIIPSVK